MAYVKPEVCGDRAAVVAAVVLTVSVEVPEALAREVGLSVQVGWRVAVGVTAQVRFTALLKPPTGAIVIVEEAVPPAVTEAGVAAEAAIVKSGAAVTVTVTVVVWLTPPAPITVTV
jgi:hypothetical protein